MTQSTTGESGLCDQCGEMIDFKHKSDGVLPCFVAESSGAIVTLCSNECLDAYRVAESFRRPLTIDELMEQYPFRMTPISMSDGPSDPPRCRCVILSDDDKETG